MYTNDRNNFSIGSILLKVIFFVAFVLLLVWLFPTNSDLTAFYSNQFRENIDYMKDSAKSYFTTDKLPTEIGKSSKITLDEMQSQKLIIPFVDKDGNSCNAYESYAEVTKEESGYKLKVQLTCNKESDYLVEILGCYDYGCDTCCKGSCQEASSSSSTIKKTALEYEFKRSYNKEYTAYTCPDGYTLDGKYCYKTSTENLGEAKKNYTKSYVKVVNAEYTDGEQEKIQLDTIITKTASTTTKKYVPYIVEFTAGSTTIVQLSVLTNTTGGGSYDCSTTEQVCNTYSEPSHSCNCKSVIVGGVTKTVCDSCGGGTYTSCNNVSVPKTCTYPTSTSYYCPDGTTSSTGTGSSLKCFNTITTEDKTIYSCSSDVDGSEKSGSDLKCYYLIKIEGKTTYSCSSDADVSEGSGENLKCYKYTEGEKQYYCKDSTMTLDKNTHKCTKTVESEFSHYSCDSGELKDGYCYKTTDEKISASSYTYTKSYSETKWSRSKILWGWIATGNTRIVTVK